MERKIAKWNTCKFLELPIMDTWLENPPSYNAANFLHKKIAKLRCSDEIVSFQLLGDIVASTQSSSGGGPWVWSVPSSRCKYIIWVISWPLIAVMFLTVPDCRQQRWRRWFVLTFVMSIAWIGVYSYLMVWMITVVGSSLLQSLVNQV